MAVKVGGILLLLIGLATASWAIFGYSTAYPDPYATAGNAARDMEIMLNDPSPMQAYEVQRNQAIHAGEAIPSPDRIARRSQLTLLGGILALAGAILAGAGVIAGKPRADPAETTATAAQKRDLAVKVGLLVPPVIILALLVLFIAF